MDFYSMSDKAIIAQLGERLRALRLRRNMTQQQLAQAVALSLNSIKALEGGQAKLSTLVAVLRELGALEELESFIPEIDVSPMQLARRRGRPRQRATGRRGHQDEGAAEW